VTLHDGLLQLNSPARPWLIRDGAADGVDLVAEWKSDDPDWRQVLEDLAVVLTFQIHLRLDGERREVHAVDHVVEWRHDAEGSITMASMPQGGSVRQDSPRK